MVSREMKILTMVLCLLLAVPPQLFATGVVPDHDAQAANRPSIESAPNGVPVINIVTATPQGVSHNKYLDFNVNAEGLILNNSPVLSKTELAGFVLGNPNLGGTSAQVILNEVTSSNPTHLNGYTEVAGHAADVIIANPNGLSVNGAGFINTPRVTLTTGAPTMMDGKVDHFMVDKGAISVAGTGLSAENVDRFDIMTRALQVNANLHANELNLVLGRNRVEADDLAAEPLSILGTTPEFALDASLLGGMYADRIRLIGTEAGVGVRLAGDMAASVGDIVISNSGRIELAGHIAAAGDLDVQSGNDIVVSGAAVAGRHLAVASDKGTLANSGELISGEELAISTRVLDNSGLIASAGTALFSVSESLENRQGMIFSIDDLAIVGPNVDGVGLSLLNDGGIIETWDGDIAIEAFQVINRSEEPVVTRQDFSVESGWVETGFTVTSKQVKMAEVFSKVCTAAEGCWRTNNIAEGFSESLEPYQFDHALISSGGSIYMSADTISNQFSLISAKNNLSLTGRMLENIGRDVVEEWTTTTYRYQWYKYHNSTHTNCYWKWGWRAPIVDGPHVVVLDGVYGTLEAGGNITLDFSEQIDNGKQQTGILTAEPSMMPDGLQGMAGTDSGGTSAWEILFQQAPVSQPYLIETRPEFVRMNSFVNSGYLLDQLGYSPDQEKKRLGDGNYELRLLRDDIVNETGRRYLSEDYADEREQFLALMDNAVEAAPELELEVGMALKPEQVEMLTHDIVWLVEEEVAGQKVLVPRLFLARVHAENILGGAQIVADGDIALLSDGEIGSSGRIAAQGDVEVRVGGDVEAIPAAASRSAADESGGKLSGSRLTRISAWKLFRPGTAIAGGTALLSDRQLRLIHPAIWFCWPTAMSASVAPP